MPVCEGVHGCALGEKACGAHVRTHVSTCVHASEGAHVLVCASPCVCACVCAYACGYVSACMCLCA